MSQLDRRDIEAALASKGFVMTDGDHRFYDLVVDGKATGISTKISKGTSHKVYGDSLLGLMAQQLNLTKKELRDLVKCTLDGGGLIELLRSKGLKI